MAQLISKSRDEKKLLRIVLCRLKNGSFSYNFKIFLCRNFNNCELEQVEQVLDTDLSIFWKDPYDFVPGPGTEALENELSLAEEEGNDLKIAEIEKELEILYSEWERSNAHIMEGWSTSFELRKVILELIRKIKKFPDFGEYINPEEGWGYNWGNYFTNKPTNYWDDERFLDDLKRVLSLLECIEKEGEYYVAFTGILKMV